MHLLLIILNMHLLLIILTVTQVATAAASSCDPQTQYENNDGQCCKKCGPGTRISSQSSCLDPQCEACRENEYQDGYTAETRCLLQPYCDPNKNFLFAERKSKTNRSSCTCKPGHHCSSQACLTCVLHTPCKPGYRVQSKGSHTHDTVCQKCPPDTFSNVTSEDGDCKKWTVCESGFQMKASGTATSDTICEEIPRRHWLAVVVGICCALLVVIGIIVYIFRDNPGCAKGKAKGCVESCLGGPKEPERPGNPIIANPMADLHSLTSEVGLSQEAKTPEENEDEVNEQPSQALISDEIVFTDKGNLVAQEDGKKEILSRQESDSLLTFSE